MQNTETRRESPPSPLIPREQEAEPEKDAPVVTYVLLAVILIVFGCENAGHQSGVNSFEPSLARLIALGGINRDLVIEDGQWWRLFSAPMLHGNFVHYILNSIALLIAGSVLERLIGHAWFAALFAMSAVSGALFSIAINPAGLTSVGASGAIMGLFAAALVVSFRYEEESDAREKLQADSVRVLIPSLLPLANTGTGHRVDFAAHFGGAVCGAVVGLLFLALWQESQKLPPYRWMAWGFALAGLSGALISFVVVARSNFVNVLNP